MSSSSAQLVIAKRMDIYEPFHQVTMWGDSFKIDGSLNSIASPMFMMNTSMENKSVCTPHESSSREPSGDDQETTNKAVTKGLRRLAQNREAARKCRLRKKAYVQQLETSRLKLMQLELEVKKARNQGLYTGSGLDVSYMGSSGTINSAGVSVFEIEYGRWVEEQDRQNVELRNALQTHAPDNMQLQILVEGSLSHYSKLFKMKADAAKADVFYLFSGSWKASVERLFLWIGGSRPSQLLNIIVPQLENLSDEQITSINNLRLSSQQVEDAFSLGLEKLQQSLVDNILIDPLVEGNFGLQMAAAMDNAKALASFVNQADHLRHQTLLYMSRILTIGQTAQGLHAMGGYFHRLRTLSSSWAARSCDPAFTTQSSNSVFFEP
ncbi:transcription factor TGA4-like isoform X3 [Lotus japonicus]|nr:transcription factor TGA4-like isoform X3 [Lotus japonicus]XP_057442611.1 transcription factor TGA4-like isoform X3 [Lotus japonicus]